jgi:hypothetical protein
MSATITYSCDVVRARNRLVDIFLREFPQATHLLHWDDDNWPEDRSIVQKMIDTGCDFIAAPYTNKKQPMRWIHQCFDGPVEIKDNLLEVKNVGFGFTMTTRACLEKMTANARIYTDHPHPHRIGNLFGQLFESISGDPADDALLSEDYSFCQRWREIGGKVMLYCNGDIIQHAGVKQWSIRDKPGGVVG